MKMRYYAFAAVLVGAALAAFALAYPSLPARIPTHWNIHGDVDGWGSPRTLLVLGPGLMTLLALIFAALPWLSPRKFAVQAFETTYLRIMLIVVAMAGYLFSVVLWAALNGPGSMPKALLGGICFFGLLIGNLLGKVRRNFYIGIRTPWTLASERTWYATHRFAGKTSVIACAAGVALLFTSVPAWAVIGLVVAGFVAPVAYSLVYFKRLEREGTLDVTV